MPDIVVGQSIMHPGGFGWKANDWATYLLRAAGTNNVGKAYAYGYLGHGAADVFAHTYVNQYAGDHFDLTNELLVEERHIALEGYIGKYTPPLVTNSGVYLGKGYQTVRTSDALATYLRDTLIYSAEAQAQYRQEVTAPHMLAFKAYRTALDTAAETDVWRRLDSAIVRYVASQYGISLSSAQAGQALDKVASINSKINQGINVTQQELTDLNNSLTALDMRFAQTAAAAFNRVVSLESSLISAQGELEARLLESACDPGRQHLPRASSGRLLEVVRAGSLHPLDHRTSLRRGLQRDLPQRQPAHHAAHPGRTRAVEPAQHQGVGRTAEPEGRTRQGARGVAAVGQRAGGPDPDSHPGGIADAGHPAKLAL